LADYLRDPALELNSFRRQLKDIIVCKPLQTTYQSHWRYYDYALYQFTVYLLAYPWRHDDHLVGSRSLFI